MEINGIKLKLAGEGFVAVSVGVSDMWHMTRNTWHLTPETWHLTSDTWHVKRFNVSRVFFLIDFFSLIFFSYFLSCYYCFYLSRGWVVSHMPAFSNVNWNFCEDCCDDCCPLWVDGLLRTQTINSTVMTEYHITTLLGIQSLHKYYIFGIHFLIYIRTCLCVCAYMLWIIHN